MSSLSVLDTVHELPAFSQRYAEMTRPTPSVGLTHDTVYGYVGRGEAIGGTNAPDRALFLVFDELPVESRHEVSAELDFDDSVGSGCVWGCCANTAAAWTFRCSDGS